jgi:hypothetical protein
MLIFHRNVYFSEKQNRTALRAHLENYLIENVIKGLFLVESTLAWSLIFN